MFENLSERLERSWKILKGEGKITEINVAETLKDVRRALLEADVNFKVAKQFTDEVKAKALGMNVINAIKPGELMVKIVHDELARLMGGETAQVNLSGNPTVILMSGLQGSGKTTFSGKLARKLKSEQGKRPLLVACDVYRPAAIKQLQVVGEQVKVPDYEHGTQDPIQTAKEAERGIIDLDTLIKTNQDLIDTINEVLTIQENGRKARREAEHTLQGMEEELKKKLLETNLG